MPTKSYAGALFIGDPHVSSKKIGRRKDDYLSSVIRKLEHCAELCASQNLLAVITGDLLHRNDDNGLVMLNRLTRVLKKFPSPPLVLLGNHDPELEALSDVDAMMLLAQNNLIDVLERDGAERHFLFGGDAVRFVACPYSAGIPSALSAFDGVTVLLTHHDLAFGSSYPGSKPLVAIENCAMVVNGHMHDTKPAVQVGDTCWHNPGNIEPLSVDLRAHVPNCWEWSPALGTATLVPHALPHESDIFDMAGLQVVAADGEAAVAAVLPTLEVADSAFASLLTLDGEAEAAKTDDASVLGEDLVDVLVDMDATGPVCALMQALFNTVAAEAASA
jgi:hypothetical protein